MGMTARMQRAAFLIARGMTYRKAAQAIEVYPRTVEKWMSPSAPDQTMRKFVESERERMQGDWPEADDVCRQALGAIKRDGSPDWVARLTAARILKLTPPDPAAVNGNGVTNVTMNFYVDENGDPTLRPDWLEADVIDAKTPGHGEYPALPPT